jgi:hypothetical protein
LKLGALCLSLALAGCGGSDAGDTGEASDSGINTTPTTTTADTSDSSSADGNSSDEGDEGDKLDVMMDTGGTADGDGGDGDCDGVEPPTPTAQLTGTVFAPNLEIPISGALVYLTTGDPEPVPDGTYCAECVSLPCDAHFAITQPDGSFILPAVTGNQKLVVQKGQFLRIVDFNVTEGNNVVDPTASSLQGTWNPAAGMYIPRIAVFYTSDDQIENILAKIGLGQTDTNGNLVAGTEQFDHLQSADAQAVMDDPARLDDYHIIFVPCMSQSSLGAPDVGNRLDNIRGYVEAGGKWYVTDWANEYLDEPFPNYQTFHEEGGLLGGGDMDLSSYDELGTIVDAELLAWLQALPAPLKDIGGGAPTLNQLPQVNFTHNWSGIDEAPSILVQNEEGEDVDVGHHVWAEGRCGACSDTSTVRPMTVTASYGCGRMMFSTYHSTGTDQPNQRLTPQELVLLYTILEIGVCFDEPPPPPPPID